MKHTKQTLLAAFQAGDITAHVLAANKGEWSDRLTHLAGLGLFRFRAVADDDYDIDDSDCYKQEANPDIEPAVMKAQRAAELRRIREYGVWGVLTEVRATLADVWQRPDQDEPGSLWGNVADDFIGSGYDAEQLRAVLEYFDKNEPASDLEQDASLLARLLEASQDDNAKLKQRLLTVTAALEALLTPSVECSPTKWHAAKAHGRAVVKGERLDLPPVLSWDGCHGFQVNGTGQRFATIANAFKGSGEQAQEGADLVQALARLGAVALR